MSRELEDLAECGVVEFLGDGASKGPVLAHSSIISDPLIALKESDTPDSDCMGDVAGRHTMNSQDCRAWDP